VEGTGGGGGGYEERGEGVTGEGERGGAGEKREVRSTERVEEHQDGGFLNEI